MNHLQIWDITGQTGARHDQTIPWWKRKRVRRKQEVVMWGLSHIQDSAEQKLFEMRAPLEPVAAAPTVHTVKVTRDKTKHNLTDQLCISQECHNINCMLQSKTSTSASRFPGDFRIWLLPEGGDTEKAKNHSVCALNKRFYRPFKQYHPSPYKENCVCFFFCYWFYSTCG